MSSDIERQAAIEYRAERDRKSPLKLVVPDGKPVTGWRANIFSAAELQRQTFPAVSYCVPDLIPEGLTLIAVLPRRAQAYTGRHAVRCNGGQSAKATAPH
jgi:hypothetical protein